MAEVNARMVGFARQQLALGKGAWWIVDELVRHGHLDRRAARALVDRVAPETYKSVARLRRPFLRMGALMTAIGIFLLGGALADGSHFFLFFLALGPLSIGALLLSYGLPGLRPYHRGARVPGPESSGPVRLGLTLRAPPFDNRL